MTPVGLKANFWRVAKYGALSYDGLDGHMRQSFVHDIERMGGGRYERYNTEVKVEI